MRKEYDLGLDLKGRDVALVFRRLDDAEKLLRLHPHRHIESINENDDGVSARVKDHATDVFLKINFRLIFDESTGVSLVFKDSPVEHIKLYAKNDRLYATIVADIPEAEYDKRYHLGLWLRSIREYLRLFLTTNPYTFFFRFIMDRAILKMNPSQRKVSMMIMRFTALEILLIVVLVIGYVIYMQ